MSKQEIAKATNKVFGRFISRNERNLKTILSGTFPTLSIEMMMEAGTVKMILDGPGEMLRHYERTVFP